MQGGKEGVKKRTTFSVKRVEKEGTQRGRKKNAEKKVIQEEVGQGVGEG